MTSDVFLLTLETWVTQYLALFCIATIAAWAGGMFAWAKHWETAVRDGGLFILIIGSLALILALVPQTSDVHLWMPVNWFCFTMLLMFELLWLSFLGDMLVRALRDLPGRTLQQKLADGQQQRLCNRTKRLQATPYKR